jgi:deoxyribonuclease V
MHLRRPRDRSADRSRHIAVRNAVDATLSAVIVCVDVDYRAAAVVAACVGIHAWSDAAAAAETVTRTRGAPPEYRSGEFYRRELPYVVAALEAFGAAPSVVVIDGYVWLGPDRAGLGAHLHAVLGGGVAIVGVAKRPFAGATSAIAILRGTSRQALYVTSAGTDSDAAAASVRSMHGSHRIPTMLKRVDRLCRDAVV